MCLYTKYVPNPKYKPNKKNKGHPDFQPDKRLKWVPVACGKCIECRKAKAREWQIRLNEEIKVYKHAYFVTLTFDEEHLKKYLQTQEPNTQEINQAAAKATRHFLERWRKLKKHSMRHWFITERGHTKTERLHLHGIILSDAKLDTLELTKTWSNGFVYIGDYCSSKTINYIVKYMTKLDTDHKNYEPIVLCSAGIGKTYLSNYNENKHRYRPNKTIEYYTLPNGAKCQLPMYYRRKLWDDDERQLLWKEKLDKQEKWVRGIKCSLDNYENRRKFEEILNTQRQVNLELGYGKPIEKPKKSIIEMIHELNSDKYNK